MPNPLNGEQVPDHTKDRWERVGTLRLENSSKVARLEHIGVEFDVGLPRVEHFMKFLYEIGVITADQRVDEALDWEQGFNDQLDQAYIRIQGEIEAARDQQKKERLAPKLLGPQGQVISGGPNREQRRHPRG
jgi:hypothetical protein